MIITNGKVYTMEGDIFQNGYIIVENDKIKEVGDMKNLKMPSCEKVINAKGGYVFPGLIDAHAHLGLVGDGVGFEDDDINEICDPVTPHLRALDAFNPFCVNIEEARKAGVTCVITGPGSGNPIGGQLFAVKTWGNRVDNMVLKAPAAMKMALGENPKKCYGKNGKSPRTRMATAEIIRETFFKAQEYMKDKEAGKEIKFDMKMEAMIPVLKREIPVHFHCHRAVDIFTAIRIAKEFNIDYAIIHGTEGHLVADELAEEHVQIAAGPALCNRGKPEVSNKTFAAPGILNKAGVMVSITVDHPVTPIEYLTTCAAMAVKQGLDEYEAFKAITINPAIIGRIDDRVGSLKAGKDADIVIFDGNPLEYATKARVVIIDGVVREE